MDIYLRLQSAIDEGDDATINALAPQFTNQKEQLEYLQRPVWLPDYADEATRQRVFALLESHWPTALDNRALLRFVHDAFSTQSNSLVRN